MTKGVLIAKQIARFVAYLFNQFSNDQCLKTAAALSFTTLLSLVPLLAVMFSILSAFPAFEHMVGKIQEFIFSNFVPTSSDVILEQVQQFVTQASNLTGIGILFLIVTALMLMVTIDQALNHIWKVRQQRKLVAKFLVYWAVLTLGPILIVASIAMTSYLVSLPYFVGAEATIADIKTGLLGWMPIMSTMIALTLLYILVPNHNVPIIAGITGGVLAAVLFEFAKESFALYIANFPTYATIYGALATIPIFLVWVYVSWIIALLGAEMSYCLTTFRNRDLQHQ